MNKLIALILLLCISASAAEPLRIWISSQQDKLYYEKMVKAYQEKKPDFKAKVEAFGFREMPDKLGIALKSGIDIPDICQLDEVLFGIYLNGKVPFVDLTDRIKKANFDKTILKQRLDLFSWDKKTYGLPQSVSCYMIYYRKDLFKEEGIKPEDLKTWKDVEKVGKKLADKNIALMAVDPTFFGVYLRQRGGHLFSKDGKFLPNKKLAVDTMKWMKKMTDDGIFLLPSRGSIFDPVFFNSAVENGEVMSLPGADWFGLDMIQNFLPDMEGQWGIMPLPTWENSKQKTASFAGQGLLITEASKKKEEAWEFMKFVMTDKKANIERFTSGNSFPAYMPAWEEKELMAPSKYFGGESMGEMVKELGPTLPGIHMCPDRPSAVFMLQENFFTAIMYGTYTVEEAFKQMEEALNR